LLHLPLLFLPLVLLLWEARTETQDTEARKQQFILQAQTQGTCVQRLSPENKGVSPYISLQTGCRGKNKNKKAPRFNPYMVICNSVVYFTLVLSPFYP
jgi:hypothetical protein